MSKCIKQKAVQIIANKNRKPFSTNLTDHINFWIEKNPEYKIISCCCDYDVYLPAVLLVVEKIKEGAE